MLEPEKWGGVPSFLITLAGKERLADFVHCKGKPGGQSQPRERRPWVKEMMENLPSGQKCHLPPSPQKELNSSSVAAEAVLRSPG